jgi:preprotein translocase subunit SecA
MTGKTNDHQLMARTFALIHESLRRNRGIELYDVQLMAAFAMAGGNVAEMQTGEGKTFACAPAALFHALRGRGVHVVTPNSYLARRDFELLCPVFRKLGFQIGLLPEQSPPIEKRIAYECDVTYGTGYEFGFDYLRDQLALQQRTGHRLGTHILGQLQGHLANSAGSIQRGLACAIVDEIDNVLMDDAVSPLAVSDAATGDAMDADVHRLARSILGKLVDGRDYRIAAANNSLGLTPVGIRAIHADDVPIPVHHLTRTWTEYVEQALRAHLLMHRDVHYIVRDGSVQIVDASTGRIFSDRSWRDGLHQAVEAKEGLRISTEKQPLAQITRQRFFRLYETLCGMSGTAIECRVEFQQVYGLRVTQIPLRVPSQRIVLPVRFFSHASTKWDAIADSVRQVHVTRRPVLIGTRSIQDSERLAGQLSDAGIPFQLLNGRQDAEEATVIAQAGREGMVTISTNLAGRGTDIRLHPQVAARGGLHVIVAECHESSRVDRQLIGRCARQGDPGSAQKFISAEDSLIQNHGAWLLNSMTRYADSAGEVHLDLTRHVERIQRAAERNQFAVRTRLLDADMARDSLLTR